MKILFITFITMLFIAGCSSSGKSSNLPKTTIDNEKDLDKENKVVKNLPIVIIGPSTVYINKEQKSSLHYSDDSECPLYGWGELLGEFSKDENIVYNYARPGAGAGTFKDIEYDDAMTDEKVLYGPNHDHYWAKTKEKMAKLGEGILLIQFGGNDPRHIANNNPEASNDEMINIFKKNVEFYVDEAKKINFIPILITSVDKRIRDDDGNIENHRGRYPDAIRELALSKGVRVLDLHQKSLEEFNKHTDEELKQKFADCYNRWSGNRENTHFEKHGAKEVASWIKELACEKPNSTLCKEFK